MIQPWNLKTDDTRKADSLPTFIIFCEDEVSEPVYFKYFETSLIKVNPVGKQKSKIENVIAAITKCIADDLMIFKDGTHKLVAEDTHVWCVYDRDMEDTPAKQQLGNTSFNAAIDTANSAGIKIAWSNDAFELWVLLHFEDVDPAAAVNHTRKTYYDRLTDIFRNIPNPNDDLLKCLAYSGFNYKENLKSANNFRNIVRCQIISNTHEAIKRAKALEIFHSVDIKPNHEKVPCTMIHHLVQELIRVGGKNV